MKRKEKYDLKKIEIKAENKINGCGKIIPSVRFVTILYGGQKMTERKEIEGNVYRYVLDWLEGEE